MLKAWMVFAVLMLGVSGAQTIARREVNQQARINQGIRSGALTNREAARLERQQVDLRRQIARDRADGGGLSAGERARIDNKQDRESRRIARQKHDAQTY